MTEEKPKKPRKTVKPKVEKIVEQEVSEDEINDHLENRMAQLKEGLIGSAEEKLDSVVEKERLEKKEHVEPKVPSTVDSFQRDGMSVSGPFARTRVNAVKKKVKPASLGSSKHVHKIWDDKPLNNVGKGKTTYNIPKGRKGQ